MNPDRFLPIGTVVLLKDGSKRIMITGYCSIDKMNPDILYDYNGCIYPEGYLNSEQTCLFQHNQIETIYFYGFVDEEQIRLMDDLKKIDLKKLNPNI